MRRAQMESREIDCSLKTRRRIVADWLMSHQRSPETPRLQNLAPLYGQA
jgi:hypothetical protein